MNDIILLSGSLSNDLIRVATLTQRGSMKGAERFRIEAKRWAGQLCKLQVEPYIRKIATEVDTSESALDLELAERYLMYGILLQNYALHASQKVS